MQLKNLFASSLTLAASVYSETASLSNAETNAFLEASCDGNQMCIDAVAMNEYIDNNKLLDKNQDVDQDALAIAKQNPTPKSLGMSPLTPQSIMEARKLKQLKVLVLWLQPEHRFARYCFYGCYCLPDADHKIYTVGYGKPVDNIDASCKRQKQCYECAALDHSHQVCDASSQGYNFKLNYDPADPTNHWKKSIECLDNPNKGKRGSCKRSVCECDKKLAEDLRTHYSEWFVGHHQEQGTFDSSAACIADKCTGSNCGGRNRETQCCGYLGSGVRMPFKTNGRRKCCGDKTYDSTFQECCDGDILAAVGTC